MVHPLDICGGSHRSWDKYSVPMAHRQMLETPVGLQSLLGQEHRGYQPEVGWWDHADGLNWGQRQGVVEVHPNSTLEGRFFNWVSQMGAAQGLGCKGLHSNHVKVMRQAQQQVYYQMYRHTHVNIIINASCCVDQPLLSLIYGFSTAVNLYLIQITLPVLELLKMSCYICINMASTLPLVVGIPAWVLELPFATYTQYLWHDYDKWERENRYIGC